MYSEIFKTKSEAIKTAIQFSKQEKNGFTSHIVWISHNSTYYVMGAGNKTNHSGEVIIGSYQNGKYIN